MVARGRSRGVQIDEHGDDGSLSWPVGVAGDAAEPCARDKPSPGSIPTDRADAAAVRWRPTIADTARGDAFLWKFG